MIASVGVASAGKLMPWGGGLAVAALLSWLVAEAFGAWMLRSWIVAGRRRQPGRADGASRPVVFGHAALALSGLTSWVVFVATGSVVPGWLATGFLALAIGLGVSTLTTWTPYPVRPPPDQEEPTPPMPVPHENAALRAALANEKMAGRLVDDMLARMLAEPSRAGRPQWRLAPLIPALHGLAAIATILLAVLAVVAATATGS